MTSDVSSAALSPGIPGQTPPQPPTNELGQDAFLELLLTQIQNQNPLDPSDPSEFLGQLASFSSLEQMSQISDGIESLGLLEATGLSFQNVNLVGKTVVYKGSATAVVDGQAQFRVNTTTSADRIVIEYSDGGVKKTKEISGLQQGDHDVMLDDLDGEQVEITRVTLYQGDEALDANSEIYAVAKVGGVTFEGGSPMLLLNSEVRIDPSEVLEILE